MKIPAARSCRLFIFDLDGTLIDSRADIAFALNLALARMGMPALEEARIADFVGEGLQLLVERALRQIDGHKPETGQIQNLIALFGEEYGIHLLDRTRLCTGTREALDQLSWSSFAVVSNKPEGFSRRILEGLGVAHYFCVIYGGDRGVNRKPDPEALI